MSICSGALLEAQDFSQGGGMWNQHIAPGSCSNQGN